MDISKQNPPSQPDPKTNVTALVLLVLATAIICFIILGWSSSISQDTHSNLLVNTDNNNVTIQTLPMGAAVNIPTGLFVDESASPEKLLISVKNGEAHEVFSFESYLSTSELATKYRIWFEDNNYTVTSYKNGGKAATITATNNNNNEPLIVMISYLTETDTTRVEVYSRSVR